MTESVSAGEVCSIAVAKSIGIRDESTNTSYYLKEFSDVKTFNEEKDTTRSGTHKKTFGFNNGHQAT
jgi:hypothetical protein